MSYLGLEGLHAFVTGAAGGIGQAIVLELLAAGCKVSALDLKPNSLPSSTNLLTLIGDITSEASLQNCYTQAVSHFGPLNILCANAGITDETQHPPIWELPTETWDKVYNVNVRGTFLTVKHFLLSAKTSQEDSGAELENRAVVLTGSECGKFGQAGHAEYASGKAGLQYGLVRTVKNEIVRLNSRARINAVAPGWVDTKLIEGRLDDEKERWVESEATVPLRKIAKPEDVARAVGFLASHRAAGHVSGECLSVDGGMEGRVVWRQEEVLGRSDQSSGIGGNTVATSSTTPTSIPQPLSRPKPRNTIKIALSIDFDAVSGWLGTGAHEANNMADFSTGFFSANVGVSRLLKVFSRLDISDKVTWCIPGHSLETFPEQARAIADSGAEIALHGYCHEGSSQMTAQQERDVLEKTIQLVEQLTGKAPKGYRAPLYQISERTVKLLQEKEFLWDSSLAHHDSAPYFLPRDPEPIRPIKYGENVEAKSWMHPSPDFAKLPKSSLVEIPCNWYMEDMTPMQFFPNVPNSQGYVDVRVIERMWKDRFEWLKSEIAEGREDMTVFSLVIHPDTSGMAHVIGMIQRFMEWAKGFGDEVEFWTYERIAEEFKKEGGK